MTTTPEPVCDCPPGAQHLRGCELAWWPPDPDPDEQDEEDDQ